MGEELAVEHARQREQAETRHERRGPACARRAAPHGGCHRERDRERHGGEREMDRRRCQHADGHVHVGDDAGERMTADRDDIDRGEERRGDERGDRRPRQPDTGTVRLRPNGCVHRSSSIARRARSGAARSA